MIAQLMIAVASVAALFGMAHFVRRLGVGRGWSAETQRKTVHVGVGVHAMLLPLLLDRPGFLVFAVLALAALVALRSPRVARSSPSAAVHSVERQSWGDILFLAAVTVLFLRNAGDPVLYVLPLAVLTLSDAAAALVGTAYGRRRFGADDRLKSVEGTVAFFVVTWMVAVTIFTAATPVPRENVIWLATVVAAMASLIEADSWKGLDNLFVPMSLHVMLATWRDESPLVLGAAALAWLAVLACSGKVASRLGVTSHSLRATFIALFLTAGIADPMNAVLPVLALVGHLAARRLLARESATHELDFVLVLVLVGILWLGIGALGRRSAIEFYTMTFAALAAAYAILALPDGNRPLRLVVGIIVTAIAVGLHRELSLMLAADERWMPARFAAAGCAVAAGVCAVGAAWRPAALMGERPELRFAGLALLAPALTYAWGVLA